MFGVGCQVPFRTFGAPDGFEIDDVGVEALHAGRLAAAVVVEQQFVFGGFAGQFLVPLHGDLIVAVEEIDFKSRYAPFGQKPHIAVGIADERMGDAPQENAYVLLLGVAHQFFDIHLRIDFGEVEYVGPPGVDHQVFQVVLGGEVDVVFVKRGVAVVHAGRNGCARQHGVVPPLPSGLARTDPREVARSLR